MELLYKKVPTEGFVMMSNKFGKNENSAHLFM